MTRKNVNTTIDEDLYLEIRMLTLKLKSNAKWFNRRRNKVNTWKRKQERQVIAYTLLIIILFCTSNIDILYLKL